MPFPAERPRRLRSAALRHLVAETRVLPASLIQPLFVVPGRDVEQPIASMPGVARLSVDRAVARGRQLADLGVGAVLLFGVPERKDARGTGAWDPHGPVQQAALGLRESAPSLTVMTDCCLCAYTDHGHCGVLDGRAREAVVDNDATLALLAKTAVAQAQAGAQVIAPSDMMDGRVGVIRQALDAQGFADVAIMSYAVKYASAFYGPFREAQDSAPQSGDRKSYQMDPANRREALREVRLDVAEGADIVMIKPALPYLDVVAAVRAAVDVPVAAYQVSGEYAMIKHAAQAGALNERAALCEALLAMRRAGADLLITYAAADAARWLG